MKYITAENVRLAATIIALLVPVFGCYYGIKMDVAVIKNNVDRICAKEDAQDASISSIEIDLANLKGKLTK